MSNHVLDKAFRITNENGVGAGRAVVRGAASGECALPAAAGANHVLGVTTHSQPREGRYVGVRRIGIVPAVAAEAIPGGSRVRVADTDGRIGVCELPQFAFGETADNNAVVIKWIAGNAFSAALMIALEESEGTVPFSWVFADGALKITLATTSGSTVQTAATLIAAIAADEVLSKLITASSAEGSNGSGIMEAEAFSASNIPQTLGGFAIAEETATQAGDIIDIFLTN